MVPIQDSQNLCQTLTPELRSILIERTHLTLVTVVRPNLNTQYASVAPALAELRDAISAHGSDSDSVLVQDFQHCVPLTGYDAYKPFVAAFEKNPCKEAEVENLFAPGLPLFLVVSSATSGGAPKLFPKYSSSVPATPDPPEPTAYIFFYGYMQVKEVERKLGSMMKRIPVSNASCSMARTKLGWTNLDDDHSRMSLIVPGRIAPLAASMIKNFSSLLIVHALFALARRDLVHISTSFSTIFYDLVRHVDEKWDTLLSCIKNGTLPDLPGVREVESHLQVHLHADPERAAELGEIGPPFSCEGWAARVWSKLESVKFICSGPFAFVVSRVKSILGPTISLRTPGYIATESFIATPHRLDDLDVYVLRSNNLIEFLDVTTEVSHENLRQAWELEVCKQYEVVLTTTDGLWRYRLGDTIHILGFDPDNGSPVFAFFGRRSSAIRLTGVLLTDTHITQAIETVSPGIIQVIEFTTTRDWRESTETVGYFVELAGTLGPNAHLAPLKLGEVFAATNTTFRSLLESGWIRYPTVRIVRPGTFAEYRQWKAEIIHAVPGQLKVPVILPDAASMEWILERVIQEL